MLGLLPYIGVLQQAAPDYNTVVAALIVKATIALALSSPILDLFGLDDDSAGWVSAAVAAALVFGVLVLIDFSVEVFTLQKVAENIVVALLSAATIRKRLLARRAVMRDAVKKEVSGEYPG